MWAAGCVPGLCTAWLVNNRPAGLVSAGHCAPQAGAIIQFNVPASTIGGSLVHPPPEDQYPVDLTSVQTQVGGASSNNSMPSFSANDFDFFLPRPVSPSSLRNSVQFPS